MPEPAHTDFIVIGSGIAGLRAAIALAPSGRVTVLTKDQLDESNTKYAQGGIAVVLNDDDRIDLHVQDTLDAGAGLCDEQAVKRSIGAFYSSFFAWVNIVGLALQLFVVSRVVRRFGVPGAILVLPFASLGAYGIIALAPLLSAVFAAKVAENSTDYSLNNTVRNMLFLPCTPEQKYSAKQAIDSFFVRVGDVGAAGTVFVGTTLLHLGPRGFALANGFFVLAWLLLAWRIGRIYRDLSASGQPPFTSP